MENLNYILELLSQSKSNENITLPSIDKWKEFKYQDIFKIERGGGYTARELSEEKGNTPYIGASAENNGITLWTNKEPLQKKNAITIANNGSVGSCFYQNLDFIASSDISILRLKNREFSPLIALFFVSLIRLEKYRFNYGRKWGMRRMEESSIYLPVDENENIDFNIIEKYMNTVKYSKFI